MELTLFIIISKILLCRGNILEIYSPTYPEVHFTNLLDISQSNQVNNQISHHSGYLANTCLHGILFVVAEVYFSTLLL